MLHREGLDRARQGVESANPIPIATDGRPLVCRANARLSPDRTQRIPFAAPRPPEPARKGRPGIPEARHLPDIGQWGGEASALRTDRWEAPERAPCRRSKRRQRGREGARDGTPARIRWGPTPDAVGLRAGARAGNSTTNSPRGCPAPRSDPLLVDFELDPQLLGGRDPLDDGVREGRHRRRGGDPARHPCRRRREGRRGGAIARP